MVPAMPSVVGALAAHRSPRAVRRAPRELSDEALLARFALSDPEATAVFVERFQRRVFGLALTIVGEPRGAEDIAQEALLRAWRHAAVFEPRRGSVATWLLTITRNLSIDSLRKRRAEPVDPERLLAQAAPVRELTPDEAVAALDDAGRVRAAVAQLPLDQRRAVVLASLLGHTAKEISELERIPVGTAKTRVRAGMIKLRAIMIDETQHEAGS